MAAGFPLLAAHIVKVGAVAGEGPAVVKRPADFLPAGAQVGKQLPHMQIVAVKIMKPDHVRVVFPHPAEEFLRCLPGAKSRIVQKPAFQAMEPVVKVRADAHRGHIVTVGFLSSVGEHAGVTLSGQCPTLICRDSSGAAVARGYVDK